MEEVKNTIKKVPIKEIRVFEQFSKFLKEYGVVGLAIGVVIGSSVTKYVNSIVENLISPIIGLVLSANSLSNIQWGPIKIGAYLSSTIEFLIVLTIIFFAVKYVLRFLRLVEDKKEDKIEDQKQEIKELKEVVEKKE